MSRATWSVSGTLAGHKKVRQPAGLSKNVPVCPAQMSRLKRDIAPGHPMSRLSRLASAISSRGRSMVAAPRGSIRLRYARLDQPPPQHDVALNNINQQLDIPRHRQTPAYPFADGTTMNAQHFRQLDLTQAENLQRGTEFLRSHGKRPTFEGVWYTQHNAL